MSAHTENGMDQNSLMVSEDELQETPQIDPLMLMRRSLRGLWGWAIGAGMVCAGAGALAGYLADKPLFKSEALVNIAYSRPAVMSETDENAAIPMFDSFMRSEQLRMQSREIVERALSDPDWQAIGRGNSAEEIEDVGDNLTVLHPDDSEQLRVALVDNDRNAAAIGVNAVVNAFAQDYRQHDEAIQQQRIQLLTDQRNDLNGQLQKIDDQADQISVMESLLRTYIEQEIAIENQIAYMHQQGYMDSHPRVAELRDSLQRVREQIQQYVSDLHMHATGDGSGSAGDGVGVAGATGNAADATGDATGAVGGTGDSARDALMPPAANANNYPAAEASDNRAATDGEEVQRREMIALGAKKEQLDRLQAEGEEIRKQLSDTDNRIQALRVESAMGGRLEIISPGDVPLTPSRDRRKIFAAAGATGGALLPAAILMMVGMARPKYRFSDEAEDANSKVPLLGILPILQPGGSDIQRSANAAHCVHQMRVALQASSKRMSKSYLVTSAVAGEGKTSVTVALGLSFATSGARTLLIDADMIGRRLTQGLNAEELDGLYEALEGVNAGSCVHPTLGGMWLLPLGQADALHCGTLSSESIEGLLDEARKEFDVVIIDSGPILGSVEASVIASEVDGVITVISRGQHAPLVARMMRQLNLIGAKVVGSVFNRAQMKDFYHSTYGSVRSSRTHQETMPAHRLTDPGADNFGPLVGSVCANMPAPRRVLAGPDRPRRLDSQRAAV